MAQATEPSPYTVGPDPMDAVPTYTFPVHGEYAAPGVDDALHDGWWDADGFSPALRISPVGVPDAQRMRKTMLYETREGEGSPDKFNARYREGQGTQTQRDRAAVYVDANGFEKIQSENPNAFAPKPRPSDTGEPRPTTRMSPHSYVFVRPFGQGLPKMGARLLNGVHFSMADHRRDYPILGMHPVRTSRNTYRIEPPPWDQNVMDVPPDANPYPSYRAQGADIPPMGNTSWRLP